MKSALATKHTDTTIMETGLPKDFLMDEGTVLELIRRYQETGCPRSLDRIVKNHHRMCVSIANNYKRRFDVDDTYQDCMESLIHCIKDFDLTCGFRFFSYAYVRIQRAVSLKKILEWSPVTVSTDKGFLKAFRHLGSRQDICEMTQALASDIAHKLNVTVASVMNAYSIRLKTVLSLDCPTEETGLTFIESLTDHLSPEEIVLALEFEQSVGTMAKKALSSLTPKEATVIQMRHLQETPLTLTEAGAKLGVSAERIRQIQSGAMKKMQKMKIAA